MRAMGEELQLSTGAVVTVDDPVVEQAPADLRELTAGSMPYVLPYTR